ncbi:Uncharacterized protein APZ42_012448 [Daphnia magna]|uniref:Uncharacterized protein n=1 Tax=Daphnia magna TaxID=35525 RepID=A0A162RTP4_9CRUS|nr:Uncharacterized protein APZ42_012448 [Daphnia magna]
MWPYFAYHQLCWIPISCVGHRTCRTADERTDQQSAYFFAIPFDV